MCGRFANLVTLNEMKELFEIQESIINEYSESGNIYPSENIAAIVFDNKRKLVQFKWGFIPSWVKEEKPKGQINARAETVNKKPFFKQSFKKRRTLVVTSGFYEWKQHGKEKIPVYIKLKSGEPFLLAGIYDFIQTSEGKKIGTCAIITTEANDLMKSIHDRMPVIIRKKDMNIWLDCTDDDNEQLLLPFLKSIDSDEIELIEGRFEGKEFIPAERDKKIK